MKTLILDIDSKDADIAQAAALLTQGRMIVYPTDTVYGLAVDATNQQAVDLLKTFKGQRGSKPISIAVRDQEMAKQYAQLNSVAMNLYNQFLPGPLTIISKIKSQQSKTLSSAVDSHNASNLTRSLNSSERVRHPEYALRDVTSKAAEGPFAINIKTLASGITSVDHTIGIRIISHPFVTELFKHIDFPITATSANISNNPNPRSLEQWLKDTPQKKRAMIGVFINAGELPYAEPSTIIDTSKEDTEIVRQGTLELSHLVDRRSSSVQSFISRSPEETKDIAKKFYKDALSSHVTRRSSPIIIALQGPLGAGKTVFTQGLAASLGISEPLRSPTYTLVKEYKLSKQKLDNADPPSKSVLSSRADLATARSQTIEGPRTSNVERRTLYHIDAWRLSSPEEFQDLGLDDMIKPGNIIVIEWPQRLQSLIQEFASKARLVGVEINGKDTYRSITVIA